MAVESTPQTFTFGRVALWVVLAILLLSIGYSLWIVIANWTFITV